MRCGPGARSSGERGVTLVELLVTLAVILVLVGVIVPTAKFAIKRQATRPGYEKIKIRQTRSTLSGARVLSVSWEEDKTTTPPFSYHIRIFDNPSGLEKPLLTASRQVPHARSATLDVSALKLANGPYYLFLECVDILDRRSETAVLSIPSSAD